MFRRCRLNWIEERGFDSKRSAGTLHVTIEGVPRLAGCGMSRWAYYMAGYAVECALKAVIARATQRYEFPDRQRVLDSHVHKADNLVKVPDLELALQQCMQTDRIFRAQWDIVRSWRVESRYERTSADKARQLLEALVNREHGVMACIKQHL